MKNSAQSKRPVGRPRKEIDLKQLIEMCQIMCTEAEISQILGVNIDTLSDWCKTNTGLNFSDFYKTHSSNGKCSLRRQQYKLALEGNPTMLIWMGKNQLGQRDMSEIDQRVEITDLDAIRQASIDRAVEKAKGKA